MNRRLTSASVGLAAVLSLVFLACEKSPPPPEEKPAQETELEASTEKEPSPEVEPLPAATPEPPLSLSRFYVQADGTPFPALPSTAPQRVKIAVALFAYAGAQGVPENFRSREAALELAQKALSAAEPDFAAALAQADPGSQADLGFIKRGVLEPSVEQVVFQLEKGKVVKEPLDTPRGFWVVRRIQ